jgi:hypothetical protein
MALIVSNGNKIHIDKSIDPGTLGTITTLMAKYPFKGNDKIKLACHGDIKCWGFKQNSFLRLFNEITPGDHLLLFENKNNGNIPVVHPRVFYGKVVHKEENPNFASALWGPDWHYVYFLTNIISLPYSKKTILYDNNIFTGTNWFRFKQQRFI